MHDDRTAPTRWRGKLFALLAACAPLPAWGVPFEVVEVLNSSAAIPGGSGSFTTLLGAQFDGDHLVFQGLGSGLQAGIYTAALDDTGKAVPATLQPVADRGTLAPLSQNARVDSDGEPNPSPPQPILYAGFGAPSLSGDTVAFAGLFPAFEQRGIGIYAADLTQLEPISASESPAHLEIVVDGFVGERAFDITTVTGLNPTFLDDRITYGAAGVQRNGTTEEFRGILAGDAADADTRIVPTAADFIVSSFDEVPGTTEPFSSFTSAVSDGERLAFSGGTFSSERRGIFIVGEEPTPVVDNVTPLPGDTSSFSFSGLLPFAVDGEGVLFRGQGSRSDGTTEQGLYRGEAPVSVEAIVTDRTPVPGGTGTFAPDPFQPSLHFQFADSDGGNVVFTGADEAGGIGLFGLLNGELMPIVRGGDLLPFDQAGTGVEKALERISGVSIEGGTIRFTAVFADDSQAIYATEFPAEGEGFVWEGNINGLWNELAGGESNWVDSNGNPRTRLPALSDAVTIDGAAVEVEGIAAFASTLEATGGLAVSSELTVLEGGSIEGLSLEGGRLVTGATLTLSSDNQSKGGRLAGGSEATVSIAELSELFFVEDSQGGTPELAVNLVNEGQITQEADVGLDDAVTLINRETYELRAGDVSRLGSSATAPRIVNEGTFKGTLEEDSQSAVEVFLVNERDAMLSAESGTLRFTGGGEHRGGGYQVEEGATLELSGAETRVTGDVEANGAGTLLLGEGAYTVEEGASATFDLSGETLVIDGATLGGEGEVVNQGAAEWRSGALRFESPGSFENTGSLLVQGDGERFLTGLLRNGRDAVLTQERATVSLESGSLENLGTYVAHRTSVIDGDGALTLRPGSKLVVDVQGQLVVEASFESELGDVLVENLAQLKLLGGSQIDGTDFDLRSNSSQTSLPDLVFAGAHEFKGLVAIEGGLARTRAEQAALTVESGALSVRGDFELVDSSMVVKPGASFTFHDFDEFSWKNAELDAQGDVSFEGNTVISGEGHNALRGRVVFQGAVDHRKEAELELDAATIVNEREYSLAGSWLATPESVFENRGNLIIAREGGPRQIGLTLKNTGLFPEVTIDLVPVTFDAAEDFEVNEDRTAKLSGNARWIIGQKVTFGDGERLVENHAHLSFRFAGTITNLPDDTFEDTFRNFGFMSSGHDGLHMQSAVFENHGEVHLDDQTLRRFLNKAGAEAYFSKTRIQEDVLSEGKISVSTLEFRNMVNRGDMFLDISTEVRGLSYLQDAPGAMTKNRGTMDVAAVIIREGRLIGDGDYTGNLFIGDAASVGEATHEPGQSPGTTFIGAQYVLSRGATLILEVVDDTTFDQLIAGEGFQVEGDVIFELIDGFALESIEETFRIGDFFALGNRDQFAGVTDFAPFANATFFGALGGHRFDIELLADGRFAVSGLEAPEPNAGLLLLAALLPWWLARGRRRRTGV